MISSKTVKTRKPHRCHGCMNEFNVGTIMLVTCNKSDGKVYSLYYCEWCENMLEDRGRDIADNDGLLWERCVLDFMEN